MLPGNVGYPSSLVIQHDTGMNSTAPERNEVPRSRL